jgi:8-oxo-dGTP pyrophosphatase MutT (NUDIX family)
MQPETWEQLGSELAFEAPRYRVRRDTLRLPSGRIVDDYTVGELRDYALVVAVTPDRQAVLVRQWKQGVRRITLELPGGMIDDGETPAEAAARELREETGFAAPSLLHLGSFDVDASKASNQGHVFLAVDAEPLHEPEAHEMETPEVVLAPVSSLTTLIDSGDICGGASVAGLLQALRRLG